MIELTENIFVSFPTHPSYFNIMTQKPKYRKILKKGLVTR